MQVPQIRVVQALNLQKQRRKARRPQHSFNLKAKPFEIVPCMIAPVLPGETLTNLLYQSRVVSDPIKNPLIGWWQEYYFLYIPLPAFAHQTLSSGNFQLEEITGFVLDPASDLSAIASSSTNNVPLYMFKSGVNFVEECLVLARNFLFRDEDDYAAHTVDQYPGAKVDNSSWLQSLKLESAGSVDTTLPGVVEMEDLDVLPSFQTNHAQYELMRDAGLTDATYEDFLRSYGVSVPKGESIDPDAVSPVGHVPELVRFLRKWTYPTNHVDPATGAPTSAVSWSIAERSDKRRFFKHPGFIFGVSVTRPKLYFGNQKGAAVGMLKNAYTWLPAVLNGLPYTSVLEQLDSATEGILQNMTEDYWFDVRDLFTRGDQFVNHAMTAAANHGVALPAADDVDPFMTEALVDSLFVTGGSEYIRQDGVVHLDILSNLGSDTTG